VPTLTDHQLGMVAEVTYGTPPLVTRFLQMLDDAKFDFDPMPLQGVGMTVGAPGGINRADRRIPGIGKGSGTISVEAVSKGLGVLLNACAGTGVSTLVAGSTFQQNFTPTLANTLLPSLAVQAGIVDNTGVVNPFTFAGVSVNKWTLECPEGGIAKLKAEFDAKSMATATALATASYAAAPSLFSFIGGTITLGGAVTVPTATAIGVGGTANGNIRSWALSSDNNLDDGRWVVGSRNQPTVGKRKHSLKFRYEYNDNTVRTNLLAQSSVSFTATHVTTEALSTGVATLQLVIPAIKINPGSIPEPTLGQTVVTDVEAEILWDGTNQPFYVVLRTADTTL
jgi:Phage tail tube protein